MGSVIAVAVSGGIDSLTAAFLLKNQGFQVKGIHFLTGFESDRQWGQKVGDLFAPLGIPVHILDCRAEFKSEVVDYFIQAYLAGQTPNPCVVCNSRIKFGPLLNLADRLGAKLLATGHYAQKTAGTGGRFDLVQGVDPSKDQSYFLAQLTRHQLARACFPLGKLTKTAVVRLAGQAGLAPLRTRESQDVCFINMPSYHQFLAQMGKLPNRPGQIVTTQGQVIGHHRGLCRFTIGQRRGINCPDPLPFYVVRLDMTQNRLVVGRKNDLLRSHCKVVRINWIAEPPAAPRRAAARIRYRGPAADCLLSPTGDRSAELTFDKPQAAVTPGQAAVFYHRHRVLGGGWIDE
jgi:tRNA-specific 2-thiouridylase